MGLGLGLGRHRETAFRWSQCKDPSRLRVLGPGLKRWP